MANEYFVNRMAFGTFSFPANGSASTASTLSTPVSGVYIPSGAIITAIKYVPVAVTAMSNAENATMNLAIGTQVLGTADAKISLAIIAGSVYNQTIASAGIGAAALVSTGGQVKVILGASQSRSDLAGTVGVYIGYLASM